MKFRFVNIFYTFFLLVLNAQQVFGQAKIFNRVYPAEGKTFEHVTGIVQDRQGYMWLVSKKGLYKYDGYRMISFRNNPLNSNSVASNLLETIVVDSQGIVWIGTLGNGLDRLDPATGNFTHYRHDPKLKTSLSNDTVASLLYDHEGTLWIGTHQGLDRFDPETSQFVHYRHDPGDPQSITNNQVRSLYEDHRNTIWVGTGSPFLSDGTKPHEGGLNRMDKKTGKFTRYLHIPGDRQTLINNKVRAIFEDSKGNFWVGTAGDGLHIMDRSKGTFRRYTYNPSNPKGLSRPPINPADINFAHITFITEDATGGIWIGTADAGVSNYDVKRKIMTHYTAEEGGPGEFSGSSAWAAYNSRDGVLWISNIRGDLFYVDPFPQQIPHYGSVGVPVGSFYQEPAGTLWIATANGLVQADNNNKVVRRFQHDPMKPESISGNALISISVDREGRMWVGSVNGLNLFDKEKGTFRRFVHDPENERTISHNFVTGVYQDSKRNIWLGTMQGISLFNPNTGTFKRYIQNPRDTTSFGSNLVTSILEDNDGILWIGTWGQNGVNQFDRQTSKFHNYLKGSNIASVYQDAEGVLWAGGDDGLYRYDRASKIFSRFIDPSSMTGITDVISIVEDNRRNLWMGSTSGIFRLNPQRNATALYNERYGVAENVLMYLSSYKARNGDLFFGDTSGYFRFFPNQITQNARPPEILVTAFRIANRLVEPGRDAPFLGPLWSTRELRLSHDKNVFSFDVIPISYSDPERNRTLYMLEDYDQEWRIADKSGRIYYFNIPPGNYVFKLKAANSHGVWTQKDIKITITPPWWQTWWAYLLFAALFFFLIWAVIYLRSRSLIKEKHALEEKVRTRTTEIVRQKEEISNQRDTLMNALDELKSTQAQLIQREKMASLGELTSGIAHEIQNPLNFVNNFSDVNLELIEEMRSVLRSGSHNNIMELADDIAQNEQKIHQHGRRADAIVKGMLQHSRNSSGKREPTDINALTDEYLRLAYHGIRAKDKTFEVALETHFAESLPAVSVVPQDIGRVLINLFNNAFYSVTKKAKEQTEGSNYKPSVILGTAKVHGQVVISVRDNGTGIPAKVLDKIYQPFFTTKPSGEGTGLGLSLSYDLIKAHGGELIVQSTEGQGAEFTITLPVG
ncbi:hypothetical protein GZH53_06270 [Flavihumibacter sp. R14]|nr:hypothetical protein [Flavihumibacter soli]